MTLHAYDVIKTKYTAAMTSPAYDVIKTKYTAAMTSPGCDVINTLLQVPRSVRKGVTDSWWFAVQLYLYLSRQTLLCLQQVCVRWCVRI